MGYRCFVGSDSFFGRGCPHVVSSKSFLDFDLLCAELGDVVRRYGNRTILRNNSNQSPNTMLQRLRNHLSLIDIIEAPILKLRKIIHQHRIMILSQSKGVNRKLRLDVVLLQKE